MISFEIFPCCQLRVNKETTVTRESSEDVEPEGGLNS